MCLLLTSATINHNKQTHLFSIQKMHSLILRTLSFHSKNEISALNTQICSFLVTRGHSSFDKERKIKEEVEFRVLQILPRKRDGSEKKERFIPKVSPPRSNRMAVDQEWSSVWPGPRSFHPASVPLPIRQGYREKGAPPGKYGNAELMKIPNFLHLTPPAITKHCAALKQWCTPWPEELETDDDIEKHFPVEVIVADYCHSSPTIRDPQARVVSIKLKLSALELDEHARDKMLRLVGERYDPKTDVITITTDSCPLKKQNYDYAMYLFTALYHESWNTESWESEKSVPDMEKYIWEEREGRESVLATFAYNDRPVPDLTDLGNSVERLFNDGETEESVNEYKKNVLRLLL